MSQDKGYDPDRPTTAVSPDQPGFFNEGTLSATAEAQRLREQNEALQWELNEIRSRYELESAEELLEQGYQAEDQELREHLESDEFFQQAKQQLLEARRAVVEKAPEGDEYFRLKTERQQKIANAPRYWKGDE